MPAWAYVATIELGIMALLPDTRLSYDLGLQALLEPLRLRDSS